MALAIQVSESATAAFSGQASVGLHEAVTTFAQDLVDEANRLEAGRNASEGAPEVTRAMVADANELLRRGLYAPKKSIRLKLLRIAAAVLPLLVGIMYEKQRLQDGIYLLLFVVVVAVTILAVTLSVLKE